MGSMIAQEMELKDGDGTLSILPSKYKRRKVSVVRDFPCGCGPNGGPSSIQTKVKGHDGPKEDINAKDIEAYKEKGGGHCEVVRKVHSEGMIEGVCHDIPVCPNGVQSKTNEKLEKLLDENPGTLKMIPTVEGKFLLNDKKHVPSENLMKMEVEYPVALEDFGVVDPVMPVNPIKIKNTEGAIMQQHLVPHYPIPSTIVGKEPNYPPRYRVAAVRDFPAGCGSNMLTLGQLDDNQVVKKDEKDAEILEASILNQNKEIVDGGNAFEDKLHGPVSGKKGYALEKQSDDDECAATKMIVAEILFKNKEQENISYNNNNERCVEQSGSGGPLDGKDAFKKTKDAVDVSIRKNESQSDIQSGFRTKKGMLVQGLMSAASCPWTAGKGPVKSIPSGIAGKKENKAEKKNGSYARGKYKCSVSKGKKRTEKFAESSMMIVPYSNETEKETHNGMYGVAAPLAVRDEDYSENEDFLFLPEIGEGDVVHLPSSPCSSTERGARLKVRQTLKLFQTVVRKLQREEESNSKEKGKHSKRIDFRAAEMLRDKGKYINCEKVIGPVPGVEIGDIFGYRIELAMIGLHSPLQSGIDTIKQGKLYVAISVVASGGYDNDTDSSDVVIYTGQGGNPAGADKRPEDQKLRTGNLALKNCVDEKTPVRVIRGFKEAKPAESADARPKTYTYDGLYSVDRYWQDIGPYGNLVYKFELRRIPGQQEVTWKEVKQFKKFKARQGRCVEDISRGKESMPICAMNTVDGEQPPPFTYITCMMYPDWCRPIPLKGCDCKGRCADSERCSCAVKNGGEIPYNFNGAIVEAKPLVYECGPSCGCPPSCPNRVSQHGIKLPLEIFKTESRGWGVRCLSSIPSGSFICEYIGELLDDKEAEQRTGSDEYLFDIGQNYNDPTLTDGLSVLMPDRESTVSDVVENIGFTIDAAKYGNIGRFINHSCSPNLYAQNVLYEHEDKRIPHVMLFAMENIPPLQELTYHYNYTIDLVFDAQGNIKRKDCYCGSSECTGRMY